MARIRTSKKVIKPITVTKFLGLNIPRSGDTELQPGESANMTNCYINKDYNLTKTMGYLQMITQVNNSNIQGMWYGNVNGTYYFLFACNGHIYKFDNDYWKDDTIWGNWDNFTTSLGTLTDAKTTFFGFGGNVYILNGYEYKKWTGTGNIADVAGYVPKIRIGCKPVNGAGTEFETLNLLTGSKRLTYKADSTTVYKLPETSVDSVDKVYVNGVLQTVTTHYTVNLSTGTVTFVSAPTPVADEDEVEIYYTKGSGTRDTIVKNRFAFIFSQAVESRIFLYGHTTTTNQRVFSSLADGIPSAEYFGSAAVDLIGSNSYKITGMNQQQEAIITFTNQPATYSATYDVSSVDLDGLSIVSFPTTQINETRGNIAEGQTQVLHNDPYSLDTTLIKWYPTQNKDERNMQEMGIRIQRDLELFDLSKAITVEFQSKFELWIAINKNIWIYNYKLDVFSKLEIEHTPTCFLVIDRELYFGTTTGQIMKFNDKYLTFNGTTIYAHWESNMYNFGADYLTKSLKRAHITLAPQAKTDIDVNFSTDLDKTYTAQSISREITVLEDVNFGDYSFQLGVNPKPYAIRIKADKFTYLKLILENNKPDSTFTILNYSMITEYGGYVR
jgi:hypothetical protein